MSPTISVIIPVFNSGKFLHEALDSILWQTYADFELIVIDDGSSDNSKEIIRSYSDPRIRFYSNDKNSGLPYTLNKGIDLVTGKFIARMDGDDIALPSRFEKQVQYLYDHPEVAMIDTIMEYIDEQGNKLNRYNSTALEFEQVYRLMPRINCLGHSSIMIRTEILKAYRYKPVANEDYDLWLRMLADGLLIHKIKEPLLQYRVHTASYTREAYKGGRQFFRMARTKRAFVAEQFLKRKRFSSFNLKVALSAFTDYITACYKYLKS
jgi:glycosyltransferase involved in cell wall biosynthesis